tara:strand:- start:48 stop:269 length:222 start_codon:yes stop_codon:yes gene_type:complete
LVYFQQRGCPNSNCVVEEIIIFSKMVAHTQIPFIERRDALKYLVHFVRDVHQPLHLGNIKDRGEAKISVCWNN